MSLTYPIFSVRGSVDIHYKIFGQAVRFRIGPDLPSAQQNPYDEKYDHQYQDAQDRYDDHKFVYSLMQLQAIVRRSMDHAAFAGLVDGRQIADRPVSFSEYF